MITGIKSLLRDWPLSIAFGVVLIAIGALVLVESFFPTFGGDLRWRLQVAGVGTVIFGLFGVGYGFAYFGRREALDGAVKGRTPPLSRMAWLARPPILRQPSITGGMDGTELSMLVYGFYALLLPLLVLKRAIELRRSPSPVHGDLISIHALDGTEGYWVCEVRATEGHRCELLRLWCSSERVLSLRPSNLESSCPHEIYFADELAVNDSKFIWHGPIRYWELGVACRASARRSP